MTALLPLVAGVELGGTKLILATARGQALERRHAIPTGAPDETLAQAAAILREWHAQEPVAALGIASFGPIMLDRSRPDYGRMLPTPKPGWSGADIVGPLAAALPALPHAFDTDVNGAALAEARWGAGRGETAPSLCYITIGTGLGGGIVIDGRPVHGALHPEIGHVRIRRAPGDGFAGVCPFHGDCIEGLVSGPALAARFGMPGDHIPADHPGWDVVASDIAELLASLLLTTSVRRVLIGGGVGLGQAHLLPHIRMRLVEGLSGYLPHVTAATVGSIVTPPVLGADAGPLGAIAMALAALGQ